MMLTVCDCYVVWGGILLYKETQEDKTTKHSLGKQLAHFTLRAAMSKSKVSDGQYVLQH